MNTKLATTQIRITEWATIIKDCKSSGMKVDDYCQLHDISRDAYYYVSAKCSCGFSNTLISFIIVGERYLDYFTTITEDKLWQLLAKLVFR